MGDDLNLMKQIKAKDVKPDMYIKMWMKNFNKIKNICSYVIGGSGKKTETYYKIETEGYTMILKERDEVWVKI